MILGALIMKLLEWLFIGFVIGGMFLIAGIGCVIFCLAVSSYFVRMWRVIRKRGDAYENNLARTSVYALIAIAILIALGFVIETYIFT